MKKLLSAIGIFGILMLFASATPAIEPEENPLPANEAIVAPCVTPKGQLKAKINQLEAQGYTLTSIDCQQIFYIVEPTPPFVNRTINVTMRKIECPEGNILAPCILLSTAHITADEVVQNDNGITKHTNVQVLFAL